MSATDTQVEARTLGDPTRYRIFRFLVEAARPVGVAELTTFVQLNHNAVRQHLAVLKEAGLVLEETEVRDRPGRPRLLYRLNPEAAGKWDTTGPYVWLSEVLSRALQRGQGALEAGRDAGRARAGELGADDDAVDLLEGELARGGFRPTVTRRGSRVDFVLGHCPFEEAASASPGVICQLHLGLAEGLAEGLGDVSVERLTARPARRAGCRLVVRREPVDASAES